MNQNYNDNEEFRNVIQTLKQLKKIDAPEDFELNLKRKINDLKYANVRATENKTSWLYKFAPGAALVLSAIAIIMVFTQNNSEQENPFLQMPPQRSELAAAYSNSQLLIDPKNVNANDVVILSEKEDIAQKTEPQVIEDKIDPVVESKPAPSKRSFAFRGYENDIDRALQARPSNSPQGYSNYGNTVNFGGFNVVVPEDERSIEELRARMDSLKRWMRENQE